MVKLKELEGMVKENYHALNANIELIADNSNLKADLKKFEDQEASWGQKLKRVKDYIVTLNAEVDKLKKLVAKAEEKIEKGRNDY